MVALIEQAKNIATEFTQPVVAQIEESYFLESIIGKISWSHHLVLLDKCPALHQRFWYMLNSLNHGISKNILLMQIESNLYQRQLEQKKISNFSKTLPQPQSDFAQYLLKDPYVFDFVQAKENADERNIEEQLTQHITKFLLELGQGFAFVGRQYHLKVGGSDFYIDLLFYHTKLHCYVVVELKARAFEPGDPAQLNFYINVINDILKTENDNETIGILLCKGKNEVLAEYALKGYARPIGVADYELSKAVPADLKSTLPSIEEIENELKGLDENGN
jgi:predicted nuclease of restriction endonuclease-like (RecB) superfamily